MDIAEKTDKISVRLDDDLAKRFRRAVAVRHDFKVNGNLEKDAAEAIKEWVTKQESENPQLAQMVAAAAVAPAPTAK